jgi:hypothetical protein
MKWIVTTSLLLLLVGCSTAPPASSSMTRASDTAIVAADTEGQVPLEQLKTIPSRTRLLKKGMTEEQVFRTLGLYDIALSGNASGPPERKIRAYELRPGYGLNLVFDTTSSPAKFLSARLQGQGWKKI